MLSMIQILLTMTLFLSPTDPQLNEESFEVCPCEILSSEIQDVVETMEKMTQVGLAAPQIGIQKSIILVDLAADATSKENRPEIQVFINPEIIWKSEEMSRWTEGSFSTGKIHGIVPRHEKILLRSYDREGNISNREFSGYTARIFQQQIDLLDGIRFPDRIENENDLHWVETEEISEYQLSWENWPKKAPKDAWLRMKRGNTL